MSGVTDEHGRLSLLRVRRRLGRGTTLVLIALLVSQPGFMIAEALEGPPTISNNDLFSARASLPKVLQPTGAYPEVSTLVNNFSQNPATAATNFFLSRHGQRDILQQLSSTLGALLVELNRLQGTQDSDSNKATPPAQSQKKTAPRRRRKSAEVTIYEPNRGWIWQGALFLGLFPVLEIILSDSRDPIFYSAAFSLFLIAGMFFAVSRYSHITLTTKTLSQRDLFRQRTMAVSEIEMISKTKDGFFGATRIQADKLEIMLNTAMFDEETINDLIEDLRRLNPRIRMKGHSPF